MWGLQNLLHVLVPEEKSKFSKQDRKYHSQKLLDFLHRNVSDDIKPEMINGKIALLASVMRRRCDVASKEYSDSLHQVGNVLEERSGLKTDCWDTVTYATALMTLIGESVVMPDGMFTSAEKDAILEGVGKYNDKFIKASIQKIYKKSVQVNNLQFRKLGELKTLLDEAKEEREEVLAELPRVFSQKRSCQEEAEGDRRRKKLHVNDDDGDMVQSGATMD